MDIEIPDKVKFFTNMLSGQLRGAINLKAKEENSELIEMTMNKIYTESFEEGFKLGYNTRVEEQIKVNLAEDIKNITGGGVTSGDDSI